MSLDRTHVGGLYGSAEDADSQRARLTDGAVPIAVYGLGKMGLPLAAVLATATGNVTGVDIDEGVVESVNAGRSHVENEPGLEAMVSEAVEAGTFRATADAAGAAADASVHVIIVPTTLSGKNADLSALRSAVHSVGMGLSAGDTVIIESSAPPGTCRDIVKPLLEDASGLASGEFGLAFCPERTASGRAIEDITSSYPKVVGGIDDESTRVAELFYSVVTDNEVIPVSDVTTAECVKLFEGVYRDVNIALANELAKFADDLGVDTLEAIEVANTQPYCNIHDPGAGVGGHCIPYYPYFLMQAVDEPAPLIETARSVNESMPEFTAAKLFEGFARAGVDPEGASVAVLGVAYRPGVQETRASPALPIIERLTDAGVNVHAVDPVLTDVPGLDVPLIPIEDLTDIALDGAVLVTAHPEFAAIDWEAFDDMVVVDGRDALDLEDTGHAVTTLGRGG